jgi:integrase
MHADEIADSWWTIPKERSKNGREQRVYLTATALSLIGDTESRGYIFKTAGEADKPMTQPAMNYALRRQLLSPVLHKGKPVYGADGKPVTENLLGVDPFCPHDLRRTGATFLSALGFMDEVVDAVLNHKKIGVIKSYSKHKYDPQKQEALTEWEIKLNCILSGDEYKNKDQREQDRRDAEAERKQAEAEAANVVNLETERQKRLAA